MAGIFTPGFEDAISVTFETVFRARLREGGVRINNLFETIGVSGGSSFLRQSSAPTEAEAIDEVGVKAKPGKLAFWKRRLTPKPYAYEMAISDFDVVRTGGFDPGSLAIDAAEACSKTLDRIVIDAITADVYCDNNKTIPFNKKQYVPYDYGSEHFDGGGKEKANKLTSYKILKAVEMMRTNGVQGTIVAFSDYGHLTEFMQDENVKSTDFNIQPAMATGITNPYGGINGFVPTLMLPRKVKSQDGKADVDHIYVVGTEYIKIGTNMPWQLQAGPNPERRYEFGLCMKGMYDAVRAEEAGVVIIEATHLESSLIV